jgi:alanine dehydrogenase
MVGFAAWIGYVKPQFMKIGVPKEIKNQEYRVALTPAGTAALVQLGHTIWLEFGAGVDAGFTNDDYRKAGAQLVTQIEAWNCDLVLKVKEPLESEYAFLKNQILFTYLHLAGASLNLTTALLLGGTTALAYETLEDTRGRLPLLAPMSAVAGSMAVTVGNYYARF